MASRELTKVERGIEQASLILSNKRSRNLFFFIVSFIFILGVNGMLPLIEGDTRFTAAPVTMTYAEYTVKKEKDDRLSLTWFTEQELLLYKTAYRLSNPQLTEEEKFFIPIPDYFTVSVNSKFFFQHVPWYTATTTSIASAILLFYMLFNYLVTVRKERDTRCKELEEELGKMANTVLDPSSFEPWMENVFNQRRKISQHKANVHYALDKYDKRISYEIRAKFRKYFLNEEALPENITRKEKRYLSKKQNLLAQLEDSYIEKSVINSVVKHFKYIYPMFVYNGSNDVGRTVDNYSLIKSDGGRIAQDATNKTLLTVGMTLLFAISLTLTVVSSIQQAPLWIILNIASKLVPLLIQVPLALDYTEVFMQRQVISNLLNRRAIGLTYLAETRGSSHAQTY